MSNDPTNLTIYFADIVGSTRIYQSLGDEQAVQLVTSAMDTMGRLIVACQGQVLRTIGDEVLATFTCPQQAFECASQTQGHFENDALGVSIGFHHGSAIAHEGDIYGAAVNLAARLVSLARAGEVVTTQDTIDAVNADSSMAQLPDFTPYDSEPLATISPKGMDHPTLIHRVNWSRIKHTRIATMPIDSDTRNNQTQVRVQLNYGSQALILDAGLASIGRGEGCDIKIDTDTASRRHGVVEVRDNKIWFQDNSSNGTYYWQQGMSPIRILREGVILVGVGQLGIGALPDQDPLAIVNYAVLPG